MSEYLYSDRIVRALGLTAECNQRRRLAQGDWYLGHELQVASLLMEIGAPEEEVIAGLFHDAIQLEAISARALNSAFGADITRIVLGVTVHSREDFLPKVLGLVAELTRPDDDPRRIGAASCLKVAIADRVDCLRRYWLLAVTDPDRFSEKIGSSLEKTYQRCTPFAAIADNLGDRIPATRYLALQHQHYLRSFRECLPF